jgi:antirestriction protein ArdC
MSKKAYNSGLRADVYSRITSEIIAAIEAGAGDYVMPWHHTGTSTARPVNVASRKPYRGVNTLALWVAAQAASYPTGLWGTYRHWQELGAQVRKGERSTTVVFWKQSACASDAEETGDHTPERKRFFARGYSVFNCAQVDGYEPEPVVTSPDTQRVTHAEAFYANLSIRTVHGGDDAYYLPSADRVHIPKLEAFKDAASYYSVLYHEGVHATAAKARLGRDLSGRFGSEAYAMEEIVADTGSAMILADLGIATRPRPDHAAYIATWLRCLRNDASAIFTVASKAQAAADWMHAQQPNASAGGG